MCHLGESGDVRLITVSRGSDHSSPSNRVGNAPNAGLRSRMSHRVTGGHGVMHGNRIRLDRGRLNSPQCRPPQISSLLPRAGGRETNPALEHEGAHCRPSCLFPCRSRGPRRAQRDGYRSTCRGRYRRGRSGGGGGGAELWGAEVVSLRCSGLALVPPSGPLHTAPRLPH